MDILDRLGVLIFTHDRPPFTMLEFGACDGYHTRQFLGMLHAAGRPWLLHAFEPEPSNFATCSLWTKDFVANPFHLWPLAVGAEVGERTFHVSGGEKREEGRVVASYYGSSSLRAPKLVQSAWPEMTFRETKVPVTTLDAFATEHLAGQPIDFIWADIQGAQGDLVRGGKETLPRVRHIYVEYDNSELYEGEVVGLDAFLALLPGFEVVENYGGDVLLKNGDLK